MAIKNSVPLVKAGSTVKAGQIIARDNIEI
jgi:murein DD-endopeptidase MepM/ murein hydrolase activator NlpD